MLLVRAAIHQDQRVLEEDLAADGARIEEGPPRPDGSRPVRAGATRGAISVGYDALVAVDGAGRACPADDAPLAAPEEADFTLMEWTLPSRYCPSDALAPTATAEFGDRPRTRALIPAVASWVRERIDYVPGSSDALTAADETLLRRQGVCRDMAHLAVALLRALEVPARVVAGYAVGLEPPDFHALLEAHDGERWRLVDVTGLAPVETVVRIAAGRDAADVAWATSSGGLRMEEVSVGAGVAGVA
ncbi:MAG TPA: transglutaminase family protein [Miltoncostaeaceae bacterium]|nr:transglutaminase family protein [Miltoncostaeaceae bacterium]